MNGDFRLRWQDSISRDLLAAAARAHDEFRPAILAAISEIEAILTKQADSAGESREPGVRFLVEGPIAVHYRVNVRLREAYIFHARVFRTK